VKGFPNARYKKFATEAEASAFISADAKESETKVGFDAAAGKMERTSTGSYIVDTFPASTVSVTYELNATEPSES
jgi:viroplasmin and RNaseH domain-containing protein